MIALVTLMLTARRVQAALVVLLSALATAAAVAGPVYTAAVDRAAVVAEVENTPPPERTVAVRAGIDSTQRDRFDAVANELADLPRFSTVLSAVLPVLGLESEPGEISWLTYPRRPVRPRADRDRAVPDGGRRGRGRRVDGPAARRVARAVGAH